MSTIPYSTQNIDEADLQAVRTALSSSWLTQGPAVPEFERRVAALHGMSHAVATSNATAALHMACLALGAEPGRHVWTSPNSFVASANCALYCGADVDFVDIDPATRNLSLLDLRRKLAKTPTDRLPRIVIPVDFAGLPCDHAQLRSLADEYGFRILADSSHALGARYRDEPLGARFVDAMVLSFHAVKIITTAEGGMLLSQDAQLADHVRRLRSHGITRDPAEFFGSADGPWYYEQQELGFNFRMTDVQAALGCSQLDRLPDLANSRRELAGRYDRLLEPLPLILPKVLPDRSSAWHLYVVEIDESRSRRTRAQVFAHLRAAGVGCNVHYIPIHLQPFYRKRGFGPGDFPVSERYYSRAISIPLFPAMTHEQQDKVVQSLTEALEEGS